METIRIMENTKAFPDPMRGTEESVINQEPHELDQGMDLRDYFAAKAVSSSIIIYGFSIEKSSEWHAKKAYRVANAMMKERNQTNND